MFTISRVLEEVEEYTTMTFKYSMLQVEEI